MYLLVTNKPTSRSQASSWNWEYVRSNATKGNRTVDDRLWWGFRTESKAKRMKEWLKENNKGNGMRVTLKKVDKIPSGWE